MILSLCSGFQKGADLAGISAAFQLGIKTFGYVPKGYRTLDGNKPEYKEFGAIETDSYGYSKRTFLNVKNSDGTIRFANNFNSAGEHCTLRAIYDYKKPYIDVDLKSKDTTSQIENVVNWINENNIEILNVAGNAGKNLEESNFIYTKVRNYLLKILTKVNSL